jgi:hypothetical protein
MRSGDELEEEPAAERADVPDWLQGIADQGLVGETVTEDVATVSEASSEDAPTWLKDFAGEGEAQAEGTPEAEIDPQAIQQIEAELSAATEPAPIAMEAKPEGIGVEDELDDEEVFQWLESLADREEGDKAGAPQPAGGDMAAAPMQEKAPPEDPDASLQWLEELATERGLDVDITPQGLPAAAAPAETPPGLDEEPPADEDSPEWLREMAAAPADETLVAIPRPPLDELAEAKPTAAADQDLEAVSPPEPALQVEPEVPDWLDEAATAASDVPAEPEAQPQEVQAEPPAPPEPVAEPTQPIPSEPELAEPAQVTEAAAPTGEPEKPKRYKEPPTEAEVILQGARQALAAGDAGRALSDYKKMINRKQELNTVIEDLEEALERYPNLPTMWQALGDAYMKADRLAEAIQAYQRGMEVA